MAGSKASSLAGRVMWRRPEACATNKLPENEIRPFRLAWSRHRLVTGFFKSLSLPCHSKFGPGFDLGLQRSGALLGGLQLLRCQLFREQVTVPGGLGISPGRQTEPHVRLDRIPGHALALIITKTQPQLSLGEIL